MEYKLNIFLVCLSPRNLKKIHQSLTESSNKNNECILIKFEPILKQTLWGGDKIIPFKHLNDTLANVGESWEVSAVEGSESIVANGAD